MLSCNEINNSFPFVANALVFLYFAKLVGWHYVQDCVIRNVTGEDAVISALDDVN